MDKLRIMFLGYDKDTLLFNTPTITNGKEARESLLDIYGITDIEGYDVSFMEYVGVEPNVFRKINNNLMTMKKFSNGRDIAKSLITKATINDPEILIVEPYAFGRGKPPMNQFIDALVEESYRRSVIVYSFSSGLIKENTLAKERLRYVSTMSNLSTLCSVIKEEAKKYQISPS